MTAPRNTQADLRAVIERTILAHPRSAQKHIGPSEVGTPCVRKLGHKLAGTREINPRGPAWRPTVGTAVHTWLESAFRADNASLGWDRWFLELKVTAGEIGGERLTGRCDLYDALTHTIVDWKIPGPGSLKNRKAHGPGEQYRAQSHLYGRGYIEMGFEVERVAIYFLPSAGEIGDGYYWDEPYDEAVALAALARADGVAAGLAAVGPDVLIPQLPPTFDYCTNCPWWQPGATDLTIACPGEITPRPVISGFGSIKGATS